MNGFALEWTGEEKGPFGGVQWGEMDVYDPAAKNYSYFGYQNDGTIWSGAIVASGSHGGLRHGLHRSIFRRHS